MKNLYFTFLSIVFIFCCACSASDKDEQNIAEIKKNIEAVNSKCPIFYDAGNDVTLEKIYYENDALVYDYTVAKILNDLKDPENFKSALIYMIRQEVDTSTQNKNFYSAIIEAGWKIVYHYRALNGDEVTIEISNEELKKALI